MIDDDHYDDDGDDDDGDGGDDDDDDDDVNGQTEGKEKRTSILIHPNSRSPAPAALINNDELIKQE